MNEGCNTESCRVGKRNLTYSGYTYLGRRRRAVSFEGSVGIGDRGEMPKTRVQPPAFPRDLGDSLFNIPRLLSRKVRITYKL